MPRFSQLLVYVGVTLIGYGCSSQPQTVTATLPLVNPSVDASLVSQGNKAKAIPELKVTPGQILFLDGVSYRISPAYISALGKSCHRLEHKTATGGTEFKALCRDNEHWLLFPSLISADQRGV